MLPDNSTHETDFYRWALDQAALLRAGKLNEADIDNIAEELESMARTEKRMLVDLLAALLAEKLRWDFQPAKRSKSWESTIKEQKLAVLDHLEDNHSLKNKLAEALEKAYRVAVLRVSRETGLEEDAFPQACPYSQAPYSCGLLGHPQQDRL